MKEKSETTFSRVGWSAELLGFPYAQVMRLRRWAFNVGLRKSYPADVPVICVGNITAGGTGKTPMVAWVVQQLIEMGRAPAILTRGYKSVNGLSDEAQLLKQLTGVDVIVNPNRVAGAQAAVTGGADALVMDDGFQHMRLKRDLNIVLIDATNPFGSGPGCKGCCLPVGRLREPRTALADAHVVIVTRKDFLNPVELHRLMSKIAYLSPGALRLTAEHKPVSIIDETGQSKSLKNLDGKNVFAFCGLGNPEPFMRTIIDLGARVVESLALPDHANYTPQLIGRLSDAAQKSDADVMLTTQKDGVKLQAAKLPVPLWQLAVEMNVNDPQGKLKERIGAIL